MKKYLFTLALVALLGAATPNAIKASAAEEYIYGENIVPNGDFSVSAGEYVLPATPPETGLGAGMGALDANPLVAMPEEGNETNTVLKFSGAGFTSFWKLLTITSGETYNVSFDYKVVGTTDNIGFAFFCTSLGNRLPEINLFDSIQAAGVTFTEKDNGWKNAKIDRTFDAAQTYDSMQLWANTSNATIYFDNFVISNKGVNAFAYGDFEGFLDLASSEVSEEPGADGIYGKNAALGVHCVKLNNEGVYGFTTKGLKEELYTLEVGYEGTLASDAKLVMSIVNETTSKDITLIENGKAKDLTTTFTKVSDASKVELRYSGSSTLSINNWSIKPTYKNAFDPTKTYYESENYVVNGDFEKFDVGTKFSEDQLEGAWGSVTSYDNGGRIVKDGNTKVAGIGKFDEKDNKNYSSMFLMTPDEITVGDLVRFQFDYKLTISDEPTSYADLNFCLVGGANQSYYKIDFTKLGYDASYSKTSGVEAAHYSIKCTKLENGYSRVTLDWQVTQDKIQWNSARWLFTPHAIGDLLYVDNVAIKFLSETPFTKGVESITFDCGDVELKVGETKTIVATVNPSDADDKTLTWTSSNEEVASVKDGVVSANKEGTAEITSTASNGVKTSIVVTVLAAQESGGCGGSIIATSAIASSLALGAIALVLLKKKEEK